MWQGTEERQLRGVEFIQDRLERTKTAATIKHPAACFIVATNYYAAGCFIVASEPGEFLGANHYCPVIKKSNGRLSLDGIDDFRALTLLTI